MEIGASLGNLNGCNPFARDLRERLDAEIAERAEHGTPIYEVGKAEPVDFIDLSEMEHCGPRPEDLARQCVSYYVQDTGWPGTYSVEDLEHDLDCIHVGRVPERLPVYDVFRDPGKQRIGE